MTVPIEFMALSPVAADNCTLVNFNGELTTLATPSKSCVLSFSAADGLDAIDSYLVAPKEFREAFVFDASSGVVAILDAAKLNRTALQEKEYSFTSTLATRSYPYSVKMIINYAFALTEYVSVHIAGDNVTLTFTGPLEARLVNDNDTGSLPCVLEPIVSWGLLQCPDVTCDIITYTNMYNLPCTERICSFDAKQFERAHYLAVATVYFDEGACDSQHSHQDSVCSDFRDFREMFSSHRSLLEGPNIYVNRLALHDPSNIPLRYFNSEVFVSEPVTGIILLALLLFFLIKKAMRDRCLTFRKCCPCCCTACCLRCLGVRESEQLSIREAQAARLSHSAHSRPSRASVDRSSRESRRKAARGATVTENAENTVAVVSSSILAYGTARGIQIRRQTHQAHGPTSRLRKAKNEAVLDIEPDIDLEESTSCGEDDAQHGPQTREQVLEEIMHRQLRRSIEIGQRLSESTHRTSNSVTGGDFDCFISEKPAAIVDLYAQITDQIEESNLGLDIGPMRKFSKEVHRVSQELARSRAGSLATAQGRGSREDRPQFGMSHDGKHRIPRGEEVLSTLEQEGVLFQPSQPASSLAKDSFSGSRNFNAVQLPSEMSEVTSATSVASSLHELVSGVSESDKQSLAAITTTACALKGMARPPCPPPQPGMQTSPQLEPTEAESSEEETMDLDMPGFLFAAKPKGSGARR